MALVDDDVANRLLRLGAELRSTAPEARAAILRDILHLYQDHQLPLKLAARCAGVSTGLLSMSLREHGLAARPRGTRTVWSPLVRRRYGIAREDMFDRIDSSVTAYWYGLLWADGYVLPREGLRLVMHPDSLGLLKALCGDLGSDAPIRHVLSSSVGGRRHRQVSVTIYSARLARSLQLLNVVAGRSGGNLSPVPLDRDLRPHFVRGLFDGDGSISRDRRCQFALSGFSVQFAGSRAIAELFLDHVQGVLARSARYSHHRNGANPQNRTVAIVGPSALRILRDLYTDAPRALEPNRRVAVALSNAMEQALHAGARIVERGDGERFVDTARLPAGFAAQVRSAVVASGHASAAKWFATD
jgi:hypothetical protein